MEPSCRLAGACFQRLAVGRLFTHTGVQFSFRAQELCESEVVEVDVLGSPSLIVRAVSVDVKQHRTNEGRAQELVIKVEVDVLGFPPLTVLSVSVDIKQQ